MTFNVEVLATTLMDYDHITCSTSKIEVFSSGLSLKPTKVYTAKDITVLKKHTEETSLSLGGAALGAAVGASAGNFIGGGRATRAGLLTGALANCKKTEVLAEIHFSDGNELLCIISKKEFDGLKAGMEANELALMVKQKQAEYLARLTPEERLAYDKAKVMRKRKKKLSLLAYILFCICFLAWCQHQEANQAKEAEQAKIAFIQQPQTQALIKGMIGDDKSKPVLAGFKWDFTVSDLKKRKIPYHVLSKQNGLVVEVAAQYAPIPVEGIEKYVLEFKNNRLMSVEGQTAETRFPGKQRGVKYLPYGETYSAILDLLEPTHQASSEYIFSDMQIYLGYHARGSANIYLRYKIK